MIREQYLSLAQRQQDSIHLMSAHFQLGANWLWLGELREARTHYEQSLALYDSQQRRRDVLFYTANDPHSVCLSRLAWVLWMLGYTDQALQCIQQAMSQVQGKLMPFHLVIVLFCAARLHQYMREAQATQRWTEEFLALATEHRFEQYLAQGMILRGWTLTETGQSGKGIDQMCQGLEGYRATGAELGTPYLLALQAEAYGKVGQTKEGLATLVEAMTLVDKAEERWYEAELHRLQGELLLQQSLDNATESETCFQTAIKVAQSQQAKSWELRAATSLAKLWQSQDKHQEAYDLLSPVYNWFTEGFDTADLIDAKALLDELK